ncbi:MAG: universal stress protein [Geodermatophilaceae bacterium]
MTITVPTTVTASSPTSLPADSVDGHHRVVVGMDDDAASVAALRFAAREAAYRGGDVLAINVWHYPYTWGLPTVWPEEANPSGYIMSQLQQIVDDTLTERTAAGEPVVPITVEVVEGDAATVLNSAARGVALLVLGARHHNRLLGSVSQACTNHPPCPVVVVPAAPRPT